MNGKHSLTDARRQVRGTVNTHTVGVRVGLLDENDVSGDASVINSRKTTFPEPWVKRLRLLRRRQDLSQRSTPIR
jgi:hypothetical protein